MSHARDIISHVSCTSILDGLDGEAPHVRDRVSFVVVAKSPIDRVRQLARERGWRSLRLLSSSRNSYNHDYHGEAADGEQMPMLNVFVMRATTVFTTRTGPSCYTRRPSPGRMAATST